MKNSAYNRKYIVGGIISLIALIFIIQLFNLQIIQKKYRLYAITNSRKMIITQPARGLIYDRNGKLIVYNKSAYNLTVTPRLVSEFDTLKLCVILDISKEDLQNRLNKFKKKAQFTYSSYMFYNNLSNKQFVILQEQLYKFQGFDIEAATVRDYAFNTASHVIGYVREVTENEITEDDYYIPGENIGKSGVERYYEKYLRGEKGIQYLLKDNKNRIIGKYENGKYDIQKKAGKTLWLTIDLELQRYGEQLMKNKLGSIVAIQPKTGEILVKISAPNFDLNKLNAKGGNTYFSQLSNDSLKTLFDRSLLARYPPGSIFKILNGLIGLQEGIITTNIKKKCYGVFRYGRFRMKCHDHQKIVNLREAIKHSCNTYFAYLFVNLLNKDKVLPRKEYEKFCQHIHSFGFGEKLGADFNNEINGFIPDNKYYDKIHKTKNWKALNIISLSIGQGELLTTPLQMANYAAIIANRGYYYTPHIVKKSEDESSYRSKWEKRFTTIDSIYFEMIIDGMRDVVTSGTGLLAQVPNINICGKTGTVQIPYGEDHSVFLAFAPTDNPEIALIVYVENGGFGSRFGAAIAGLMIEKYLNREIASSRKWIENYILESTLIK